MKHITEVYPTKSLTVVLIQFLRDEKRALEKRGLIPTLDEAIADLEEQLHSNE